MAITLSMTAQHMKFMGIPMGCSMNSFKQQLINKGFKVNIKKTNDKLYNGMYCFNGKFSGELAGLSVSFSPKSRTVYTVNVRFKGLAYSKYRNELKMEDQDARYDALVEGLTKKYGDPKYYKVKLSEEFPLATIWETPSGEVSLFYSWYLNTYRNMDLFYKDYSAASKNKKEKESDL